MSESRTNQLTVGGLLTIYEVTAQVTLWQSQLTVALPEEICLQDLTEVDGAGFQALISLVKTLRQKGYNGTLKPPANPALSDWLMPKLVLQSYGGSHA